MRYLIARNQPETLPGELNIDKVNDNLCSLPKHTWLIPAGQTSPTAVVTNQHARHQAVRSQRPLVAMAKAVPQPARPRIILYIAYSWMARVLQTTKPISFTFTYIITATLVEVAAALSR